MGPIARAVRWWYRLPEESKAHCPPGEATPISVGAEAMAIERHHRPGLTPEGWRTKPTRGLPMIQDIDYAAGQVAPAVMGWREYRRIGERALMAERADQLVTSSRTEGR